jgi:hypothetical protein
MVSKGKETLREVKSKLEPTSMRYIYAKVDGNPG